MEQLIHGAGSIPRHLRAVSGSQESPAELSWGSASVLHFGGPLALDPFPAVHTVTAFLWEMMLPFSATSQFLQTLQCPRLSSSLLPRPWSSGLLLLGSRTPAEEQKARAGLGNVWRDTDRVFLGVGTTCPSALREEFIPSSPTGVVPVHIPRLLLSFPCVVNTNRGVPSVPATRT